jgi:nucleotide-binding universal stress UspA family protein
MGKDEITMLQIKKILCPTDFSDPSYEGLRAANEWAKHFSAEVILVHVISPIHAYPVPPDGAGFDISLYHQETLKASQKLLEEVAKNRISQDLKVQTMVLQGNPADQIVDLAKSEKVDVIITATHGLTGWRRFIFGSVAEKVVRFSRCPVLTVPAPHEEE